MRTLISILTLTVSLFGLETIKVTQEQQRDLGIRMQAVTSVESIDFGPYSGLVVLDKKDIITVSSNIESIVKTIYVRELEHVRKGQKLLTLRSNALLGLQQEYIEAIFESESANQNYKRNFKLQMDGIISNKRLLESKKIKRTSDLHVNLTKSKLLTNGFTTSMIKRLEENSTPIAEITIYAPKSGVVNDVNVNNGAYVQSDHKIIEIYADGKRFIEVTVPVKNVKSITIGDKSSFESFTAKVTAIGNVVNTSSQSVIVRAMIDDAQNIMINRVYEVHVAKKISAAYKVKKTALVFDGQKSLVFRKNALGFEVLEVDIIKEGPTCYIVKADLNVGDLVAATSTSALLSAKDSEDE
ncbi:MAG: cobalt-zinc-cadmium efflux system membrane fusion protein [Sulfurimonas sp.]|jgi:cobalt-zinc-cadmium efflux system membrane fusion protein|uniref:efflux RND transporter periplasmic adaptor subunit n=1 Tax=Sulfurimonas sp. TaxID=2022749 RepID=UPI0039E4B3F0